MKISIFEHVKRCRICGEKSSYTVCRNCASKKELQLIREIESINKKISENTKRLFKCKLKLPKLNPFFIMAFLLLWLFLTHSFLFAKFIHEPIVMILIGALSILFVVFSVYFWIFFPMDNVKNGVEFMDAKHQNIILKRHKKYYLKMLRKPIETWTKLEQMKMNFETLET